MDVYLFCTDGLCGMMEAIHAVYPQSRLLASQRITKRWRTRCQNWDLVLSQLEIMFSGRAAG